MKVWKQAWTTAQLAMVEELIIEAEKSGSRVDWEYHRSRIGHPLESIKTIARNIRANRRAELKGSRHAQQIRQAASLHGSGRA